MRDESGVVPDAVQADFDDLITACFDLAQMRLDTAGTTGTYAVLKPASGELMALEPSPGQVRAARASGPTQLTEADAAEAALIAEVRGVAAGYRAAGVVSQIEAWGATLVRLDLEHRDGIWQTLLLPFVRDDSGVEFGDLQNTPGVQRIWGLAPITP
ncbi:hypothetical protein JT358_02070 [Micrococcales bacterium 31B]|nr:hypothetical protein [Micrococcales bacterium 31B]